MQRLHDLLMLSAGTSILRDWGLFVLVALLPATAIGLLGLRALTNEEAAIKREMRLVLERSAEEARRDYEDRLAKLEAAETEDAPFADRLALSPPAAEPAKVQKTTKVEAARNCQELARKLRRGVDPDATRRALLADCETARSDSGRWLWLVVALSKGGATRERLEVWLRAHGDQLSGVERAAARSEIDGAAWLDETAKSALRDLLDTRGRDIESAPLPSQERYAMRMGRPRIAWSTERARGLLLRDGSGTYRGFVVHPGSLARALRSGWPELPQEVSAHLVVGGPPPGPAFFEALDGGAYIELQYRDRGAVEARTQRSKRILIGVAALACLVAIALVALLFARMRKEKRVSALRTDFVAAVSHELRTPIASMRMLSELLSEGSIEDQVEQREMHEALAREAKRLGDTVNRLLGFSRMEAGKQTAKLVDGLLAEPIEDAVATVQERHPDAAIVREIDDALCGPIDAEAVRMAVQNLLSNAIKYAEAPFTVRLRADEGGARIEVSDSGPGLSKRDQKRIFRPFERADDRLSKATEGSGIGLSLVSHVARSHRGRAGVESEVGRGSTFFLWLPLSKDG